MYTYEVNLVGSFRRERTETWTYESYAGTLRRKAKKQGVTLSVHRDQRTREPGVLFWERPITGTFSATMDVLGADEQDAYDRAVFKFRGLLKSMKWCRKPRVYIRPLEREHQEVAA